MIMSSQHSQGAQSGGTVRENSQGEQSGGTVREHCHGAQPYRLTGVQILLTLHHVEVTKVTRIRGEHKMAESKSMGVIYLGP